MPTTKKHLLFTIYLWLISLISFIGLSITVVILAKEIISNNIITNDEYAAQNHRELDRCNEPIYIWDTAKERTEIQEEECITKAKESIVLQRNVDSKNTIILWGLRTIILLIIFPLHFIYFRRYNK
jgi:hypothetical protein